MEKETRIPIYRLFDCIGGSSSDALVALGATASKDLVHPLLTLDSVVKLFSQKAKNIFSALSWERGPLCLPSLINNEVRRGPYYSADNYEHLMKACFQECKLSNSLTRVVMPCISNATAEYIFDSYDALKQVNKDFFVSDVARAAWSDGYAFGPACIKDLAGSETRTIETSFNRNNPAEIVYDRLREMA